MSKFLFIATLYIFPLYTCNFSSSSPYSHGSQGRQNPNCRVPFGTLYKGFFCSCMVDEVRIGCERIDILIFFCTKALPGTSEFCNVCVCSGQLLMKFRFWKYALFCYLLSDCCWFTYQLLIAKVHWNFELILIHESQYLLFSPYFPVVFLFSTSTKSILDGWKDLAYLMETRLSSFYLYFYEPLFYYFGLL